MAVKKSRKRSVFVIYSDFKDSAFGAVLKGWKVVNWVCERSTFSAKNGI